MPEWDRLMREREQLLKSGVYDADDLLIREMDKQIQVSQAQQDRMQIV